jgi:hypothetical protein
VISLMMTFANTFPNFPDMALIVNHLFIHSGVRDYLEPMGMEAH